MEFEPESNGKRGDLRGTSPPLILSKTVFKITVKEFCQPSAFNLDKTYAQNKFRHSLTVQMCEMEL